MQTLKSLLFILSFSLVCFSMQAQKESPEIIDPSIKTGVLSNGMTYYIKHNAEPKERVSFYFAQNVGSILETDTQQGLAHFLEHMAFNGTENFKDKEVLDYLQKNGMRFGSEINAFTSFDETVYNINKAPVGNERLIDSILMVLHDWSGSLALTDEGIDDERGVINEEWRSRNTASYRASEKVWTEGFLKGSVYANRVPIGLMSVVNGFEYNELRDYYDMWYRPDHQAVVIVGDIDVDALEKKVINVFSDIPLNDNLPERPTFDIPIETDFAFVKAVDKELGDPSLQFAIKNKPDDLKGYAALDNSLIAGMTSFILNNRFSELVVKEESPGMSIRYSYSKFVRPLYTLSLDVQPRKGKMQEALKFGLIELKRFVKYGATDAELDRVKLAYKNSYISQLKNVKKISSDAYAQNIYDHFLNGDPIPDMTFKFNYLLEKLDGVTNQDILKFIQGKYHDKGEVLSVIGSSEMDYPAEKEFLSVIDAVKTMDLKPYKEELVDKQLITETLKGSDVKRKFKIKGVKGAQGYELGNGAEIVIYPTEWDKDKIFLGGYSKGGKSLLKVEDLPSANYAVSIANESGLGTLSKVELDKKMAGINASASVGIGELSESVRGQSTKTDIEVLFQQLYLKFTAPRFEANAFNRLKERMEKNLANKKNNVQSAYMDSLTLALNNHSPRESLFTQEVIDNIDLERAEEIYKERISNARDFVFIFVGDINESEVLDLAKKYIGSIPSTNKKEEYVDHNIEPAPGKTVVKVSEKMETPQSTVNIVLKGDMNYSKKNGVMVSMVGELLQKRYMERIREQEGGSYGVGANARLSWEPKEQYTLQVGFQCNPDKADRLIEIVYEEFETLSTKVNKANLEEVKNAMIKSRNEMLDSNYFWISTITDQMRYGFEFISKVDYEKLVKGITESEIKKAAHKMVKSKSIIEGTLNPEL